MTSSSGLIALPLYGEWNIRINPAETINSGIRFHHAFVVFSAQVTLSARHVGFLTHPMTGASAGADDTTQNIRLQSDTVPKAIKTIANRPSGNIRSILNGWDAAQILHIKELNTFLNTTFRSNRMPSDLLVPFADSLLTKPSQTLSDYFECPDNSCDGTLCRIAEICVELDTIHAEFLPADPSGTGPAKMAMQVIIKRGSPIKVGSCV